MDFPGGPVVKTLSGDMGSILGQGPKIPCASGKPSPHATILEPTHSNKELMCQKERFLWTQSQINEH